MENPLNHVRLDELSGARSAGRRLRDQKIASTKWSGFEAKQVEREVRVPRALEKTLEL